MSNAITFARLDGFIYVRGNSFLYRHALGAVGGKWDAVEKHWQLPDTPAALELAERLAAGDDTIPAKRGPGRPRKDETQQAPPVMHYAPAPAAPVTPSHGNHATPDLMAALAAFVAQNAQAQAAPVDMEQVREMITSAVVDVHNVTQSKIDHINDALALVMAKLGERKADSLVIVQGDETRTITGLQHKALPDLIKCLSVGLHVWLAGPSGSGKTHGAEQASEALGLPFALQGAMTMAHELTGFVDAGGRYHETPFVRAFRNGGVILLDELDAGSNEALLALNAALANGIMCLPSGENIKAHADFKCIGAANTFGGGATHEYVGRTRIDAAFLQRFGARIRWDYDAELETAMSNMRAWSDRVQAARAKAQAIGLKVLITPRASQAGAKLISVGYTPERAAELTYLADLSDAQRKQLES